MARQRMNPASPTTLPTDRAIPILENLISEADKLRSEPWSSSRRQEWKNTGESALIAAVGQGNPAEQAFRAAQCGVYSPGDTPQYLHHQANTQLDRMLAAMRSAVQQLRWSLPEPSHVFLPAGSPHDAYIEIRRIIAQATNNVMIVDSYVDHTLWTLLSNVPATMQIRILTTHMKGDFALELARQFPPRLLMDPIVQVMVRTGSVLCLPGKLLLGGHRALRWEFKTKRPRAMLNRRLTNSAEGRRQFQTI